MLLKIDDNDYDCYYYGLKIEKNIYIFTILKNVGDDAIFFFLLFFLNTIHSTK